MIMLHNCFAAVMFYVNGQGTAESREGKEDVL